MSGRRRHPQHMHQHTLSSVPNTLIVAEEQTGQQPQPQPEQYSMYNVMGMDDEEDEQLDQELSALQSAQDESAEAKAAAQHAQQHISDLHAQLQALKTQLEEGQQREAARARALHMPRHSRQVRRCLESKQERACSLVHSLPCLLLAFFILLAVSCEVEFVLP